MKEDLKEEKRNEDLFLKISWFEIGLEINRDKEFYIKGIRDKKPYFHGPYFLEDYDRRIMMNEKGNSFMNYPEHFYIRRS